MKKKKRIKWGNIMFLILFIITSLLMISDGIKILFSTIQYTQTGFVLLLITFIIWFITGSYLENEIQ